LGAALTLLAAVYGCSAYDPGLLQPLPTAGTSALVDARVPGPADAAADARTSGPDARTPFDSGVRPRDAGADASGDAAANDAATEDAAGEDAASEDATLTDAGCGDGVGAHDCCPADPLKTAPGTCGCGVADTDGDGDDTPDCDDDCPADALKTEPGVCGCGRPDSDQGAVASCAGLLSALRHRYRFEGSGNTVVDSQGDQDGTVMNTSLAGTGKLDLAGGTSDQYVELPNGLVSALTDATFEVWLSWSGGAGWQRIFDFGDNNAAEGSQGTGTSYLFLTPMIAGGSSNLRVAYSQTGSTNETRINASSALASSGVHHVAVVIDDAGNQMRLYIDGAPAGSQDLTGSLSAIADVNNWLGRSQYSNDPELGGSLHELRIYGDALSDAQVALSFAEGPDPAFLPQ
jgi:hypothetical protein